MYPECTYSTGSLTPEIMPCTDSGSLYIPSTNTSLSADFISYDDQMELATWELIGFLFVLSFVVLNVIIYPNKKGRK